MLDKIKDLYSESIQTQISASSLLPNAIFQAVQNIVACLLRGNKIIVCGQGRSYANAQFLVANLLNRYELERPSFPSVLLSLDNAIGSAIIADRPKQQFYQRQFNAVAQQGDLLVVFSPFGNEEMVLDTINSALNKEISVIALTGANNDHIQGFLTEQDLEITAPTVKESRILEHHLFIINTICELIDHTLFSHS
ncbi:MULTISPECIES: D-sedoheptulose-7-phosphate isomerase [unclassified Avibacterium]|uniref:D-sedoheptulose-7-phosphate isomerase n=1 Tax=unclassified Avibacterium TaxID=2685287 RepID=UPI0020262F80|nr:MULTISPECIES: SIS domain-containing protein [unclassified Avibacterium]URL01150.1 SIS domain-containing protein [Avibacterium sp. 20-126]MCW9697893.1 SIS domain-containing protein [Avibacterium sp. 20-129]MCW9734120.1 SIS domain-containing protein [Avibacterium sp. 20-15]URL03764.1 SIS domain-containing protein [Avibacterium sp. 20-132]URL05774.1 SIS domain-containing protein [Avibacterium sp. 21-595]